MSHNEPKQFRLQDDAVGLIVNENFDGKAKHRNLFTDMQNIYSAYKPNEVIGMFLC